MARSRTQLVRQGNRRNERLRSGIDARLFIRRFPVDIAGNSKPRAQPGGVENVHVAFIQREDPFAGPDADTQFARVEWLSNEVVGASG